MVVWDFFHQQYHHHHLHHHPNIHRNLRSPVSPMPRFSPRKIAGLNKGLLTTMTPPRIPFIRGEHRRHLRVSHQPGSHCQVLVLHQHVRVLENVDPAAKDPGRQTGTGPSSGWLFFFWLCQFSLPKTSKTPNSSFE